MSYLRNMVNDTETCRDVSEPSIAGNFRTLIAPPPHDESPCDQHPHPWSNLAEICGLLNFKAPNELRLADEQLFQHTLIKAGQHAHCIGQQFEMLYLVNAGFLKTVTISDHGQEVVLRFPMKGDLLGVDGICSQRHPSAAVALSDCDLIMLPFHKLASLGRRFTDLENIIYQAISRDLVRGQSLTSAINGLTAEAKVARFLLTLADRYGQLGYSSKSFNLQMTRQEIGSYLGLSLETVSRTLSALSLLNLIDVRRRTVDIINAAGLKTLRRLPPSYLSARSAIRQQLH